MTSKRIDPNTLVAIVRRRRHPGLNPPGPSEPRMTEEGIERIVESGVVRVTEGA